MTPAPSDQPLAYLNGEFVPLENARLPVFDRAIVLGATVTDMTRTINHRPFRLDDHLTRFLRSAKYAGIEPPIRRDQLRRVTLEVVEQNCSFLDADQDLGVIHFMSPGPVPTYGGWLDTPIAEQPTLCIHTFPLPFQHWAHWYSEGAHAVVPPTRHVPPHCVDAKIKHRSRMHWWLAERESSLVDPACVTLLLDLDGNVTECSGANFFVAKGDELWIPSPRNTLPGVSLATVRDLAPQLGLQWIERDFQLYDVINADEAMIASTPFCLAPATRINALPIGDGKIGPVFGRLIAAWGALVDRDLLTQNTKVEFPSATSPTGS